MTRQTHQVSWEIRMNDAWRFVRSSLFKLQSNKITKLKICFTCQLRAFIFKHIKSEIIVLCENSYNKTEFYHFKDQGKPVLLLTFLTAFTITKTAASLCYP